MQESINRYEFISVIMQSADQLQNKHVLFLSLWTMIHLLLMNTSSQKKIAHNHNIFLRKCCMITRPLKKKSVCWHVRNLFHNSVSFRSIHTHATCGQYIYSLQRGNILQDFLLLTQFLRHTNAPQRAWERLWLQVLKGKKGGWLIWSV